MKYHAVSFISIQLIWELEYENTLSNGAKLINPIANRDWGDRACYFADPDGYIIAFAEKF